MVIPNKLLTGKLWWSQFPFHLRLITKIRFFASFGAGGVIYLTSLIFNNIGLSATEIGLGFTISAIIGTLTRIVTGNYLNKTGKIQNPLVISSFISIAAGFCLIISKDIYFYILGQAFIGAAAGIYWPTAEFVVPYFCQPIDTRKAYALVRTSEALGIFLGVFIGGFMNNFIYLKSTSWTSACATRTVRTTAGLRARSLLQSQGGGARAWIERGGRQRCCACSWRCSPSRGAARSAPTPCTPTTGSTAAWARPPTGPTRHGQADSRTDQRSAIVLVVLCLKSKE